MEQVLDLPWKYAEPEINSKLINTYLRINGSVMNLRNATSDRIIVRDNDGEQIIKARDVQEIKIWLPSTGVYFDTKGNAIKLIKKPNRQWKRSFHYDNYEATNLSSENDINMCNILIETRTEFWVDNLRNIRYYHHKIGYIEDENYIVCENQLFLQELSDWCRQP
ncbi:MAG: hypothetical protein ABIQ41_00115 [Gemmatimonadales bacterium]